MRSQQPPVGSSSWGYFAHAWKLVGLCLVVITLGGCKAAIYTKMSESDANDTLYTLLRGGVDAEKRVDPEGGFSVWAEKDELSRALGLLKANAQPEQKHPTLGELFGRNQLISTPVEERIRFVYGTEQALAQTLSKIDGVLIARVHIVLPVNDPLATETKPSSASVFIKHRAGKDMAPSVPAIKELVVRGIEGLSLDRVAVTLFAATGMTTPHTQEGDLAVAVGGSGSFLGVPVPSSSVVGLWWRFVVIGLISVLLMAFVGRGLLRPERPAASSRHSSHQRSKQVPHG